MLKKPDILLLIYLSAALAFLVVVWSSAPPPHHQTVQTSDQSTQSGATKVASAESSDDRIARYTLWLAIFTGALVIVSAIQMWFLRRADETARITADAAKETADAARQTLIASHRAWVRVGVLVGDQPLTFNGGGAQYMASIELTNTGNAPALRITTHVWLMSQKSGEQSLVRQRALCEGIRGKGFGLTTTLFPGETFPRNLGFGGMHYSATLTPEEVEAGLAFDRERKCLEILIVGCVNYTFPSDPKGCHQTWFMFDLRKNDGKLSPIRIDEAPHPPETLIMREAMAGMGRYAD